MRNLKDFSSSGTSPTHRNDMVGVCLKVYDVLGREVATLVDAYQSAGNYQVTFNGSRLSSGIYFYKINAGNYKYIRKMQLTK